MRTGFSVGNSFWPNGVVFYKINPNITDQSRITTAIAHWENRTGIRFIQQTVQSNYVEFVRVPPGYGCSSDVGKQGGRQTIDLADTCPFGSVVHEIGHALGLVHEHQRADRNNFVVVNVNNSAFSPQQRTVNYDTYPQLGQTGFEFGTLDFGSIMMYGSFEPGNSQPVITRLDGSTFERQRNGLSDGDVETINRMYFTPRANLSDQLAQDDSQGSVQDQTYNVYVNFFTNDQLNVRTSLAVDTPVRYVIYYQNYNTGQLTSSGIFQTTVPAGSQTFLIGQNRSNCSYNQYGEVNGSCTNETIVLVSSPQFGYVSATR